MTDIKDVDYIRNDLNRMAANQVSLGLLTGDGAKLIRQVADATETSDNDGISVGQIHLPLHDGVKLKRLFVITGPKGEHILYVPEQPKSPDDSNKIFYENHDLRRTGFVLGEFLGKSGGLAYMLDLIPEGEGNSARAYFEEVSRLPSQWKEHAITLAPVSGATYAHQIQTIVNR